MHQHLNSCNLRSIVRTQVPHRTCFDIIVHNMIRVHSKNEKGANFRTRADFISNGHLDDEAK